MNNVGLLLDDLSTTAEGFETSYATNLLTHWVLTEALLQGAALAPQATVIEMSSGGMYNAPLTLDYMGMKDPRKYNGVYAYAVHKRGQAELVKYWQTRHGAGGLRCYVMHPGWADTDGVKTAMPNFRRRLRSVLRDSAQGADTALWLAADAPDERTDRKRSGSIAHRGRACVPAHGRRASTRRTISRRSSPRKPRRSSRPGRASALWPVGQALA